MSEPAMTGTYESIQAGAQGAGVDEWRKVDKARSELAALYRRLAEDGKYTEEHKAEASRGAYEKAKARVEELAPEARRKMQKSAETLERMSIPKPEGESLLTKDTDKLLLTAHERNRVEGLISRAREAAAKGPFSQQPADILRGEYERGLDEGGPSGGATVRAVVGLVRDLGLDIDAVVAGRRKDFHRSALEDALEARMRADMVSNSVPEPPFKKGAPRKNLGTYTSTYTSTAGALSPASPGTSKSPFKNKRRPAWK